VFNAPAILLIGNDPTEQHPLLAWQIRNAVRLHNAKLYIINSQPIKLRRQATAFAQVNKGGEGAAVAFLAGNDSAVDTAASSGLPSLREHLRALYVVGSNPVARYSVTSLGPAKPFVVVQDLFLTETATLADVVLPAASAYEKSGTFTNTCGDLQQVQKAGDFAGTKTDFEIIVQIASRMGFDVRKLVPFGAAMRADMGQSRGAQSGEADRHAVWLRANNLEPKMSPL